MKAFRTSRQILENGGFPTRPQMAGINLLLLNSRWHYKCYYYYNYVLSKIQ